MSTIATTNLKNASSGSNNVVLNADGSTSVGGNLAFNSGYGSSTVAYGCRAWVNFNGTTASPSTIRGSGNISSVTKSATGQYVVNFTTAMPDANYALCASAVDGGAFGGQAGQDYASTLSTSSCNIRVYKYGSGSTFAPGNQDAAYVYVAIFR